MDNIEETETKGDNLEKINCTLGLLVEKYRRAGISEEDFTLAIFEEYRGLPRGLKVVFGLSVNRPPVWYSDKGEIEGLEKAGLLGSGKLECQLVVSSPNVPDNIVIDNSSAGREMAMTIKSAILKRRDFWDYRLDERAKPEEERHAIKRCCLIVSAEGLIYDFNFYSINAKQINSISVTVDKEVKLSPILDKEGRPKRFPSTCF